MTWREQIQQASDGVIIAYADRRKTFKAARDAGLSLRQIADAANLSPTQVHKIVGKSERVIKTLLDEEAVT